MFNYPSLALPGVSNTQLSPGEICEICSELIGSHTGSQTREFLKNQNVRTWPLGLKVLPGSLLLKAKMNTHFYKSPLDSVTWFIYVETKNIFCYV